MMSPSHSSCGQGKTFMLTQKCFAAMLWTQLTITNLFGGGIVERLSHSQNWMFTALWFVTSRCISNRFMILFSSLGRAKRLEIADFIWYSAVLHVFWIVQVLQRRCFSRMQFQPAVPAHLRLVRGAAQDAEAGHQRGQRGLWHALTRPRRNQPQISIWTENPATYLSSLGGVGRCHWKRCNPMNWCMYIKTFLFQEEPTDCRKRGWGLSFFCS